MKTRFLGLAIACVVLAALSGVLYWSNRRAKTPPAPAEAAGPTILKIDPANVTAFTIRTKNAPAVSLARDANQAWQIVAPEPMRADPEQVSLLLSSLSPLTAQEVVENKADNLNQYGLDSPALEIDLTEKNRSQQRLLIGDDTPVGGASYAMLAGDPRVYTTYGKSALNKSANDLRDKRLITLTTDQMSRIELDSGGAAIVLARNGSGWALEKPAPYRTDSMAADGLASALADAEMADTQPPEKQAEADFANGNPVATVKVTGASGTQTLEVRKGNTADFVKSSVVPGVYQADLSLGDSLSKSVDDFRNKSLFDFNDAEPDAVDLQIGGPKPSSVELVHNAQGWWRDGKRMDTDSVESLVSGFRDLMATRFATSGFTTPMMTATVTSNGGKRIEKVEIAEVKTGKSASGYLARCPGDASLYVLDPGAVERIESAAAGIRPQGK